MAKVKKERGGFEVVSRPVSIAEQLKRSEADAAKLREQVREAGRKIIDMNSRLGYTETAEERIKDLESRIQSQRRAEWELKNANLHLTTVNGDQAKRIEFLEKRVEELDPLDPEPVDEEDCDEDDDRTAGEIARDIAGTALRSVERFLFGHR